jgi:hypothetical protein
MLIERIKVTADGEYEIEPVPAARPFFTPADSLLLAPPDGRRGARGKAMDPLAWYASARSRRRSTPASHGATDHSTFATSGTRRISHATAKQAGTAITDTRTNIASAGSSRSRSAYAM